MIYFQITYGAEYKVPNDWVKRFVERSKSILAKRRAQSKEENRVKAEKEEILTGAILTVKKIIDENKILPCNIWNIDETPIAFDTSQKELFLIFNFQKVISNKKNLLSNNNSFKNIFWIQKQI